MSNGNKFVLIAPGLELEKLARAVARELNIEIKIVNQSMDEAMATAIDYQEQGVDCIISRGPTGILLKNVVNVPVFLIQVTAYDIIQAVKKASYTSKKVAYIDHVHRMNAYDFEGIKSLINLPDLKYYFYCHLDMLTEQLDYARSDNIELVVATDDIVLALAREKGMKGITVNSTYEAVADAMIRAKEFVKYRNIDRQASLVMKTIMDHTDNAIIYIDDKSIIHLSEAAGKLLGIKKNQLIGKTLNDLASINAELVPLINDKDTLVNRVVTLNKQRVVVNCITLESDHGNTGKVVTINLVSKIVQMEADIRKELSARGLVARYSLDDIIAKSKDMKKAVITAKKYALNDSTVLITGESGTGKEIFAHGIHQCSMRSKGPFVSLNCAAIPENLLESELFGYSDGAFTGASKGGKQGLFELAHGGTLFLDEIAEMPLSVQSRLLRVLQEKAVRRIGGDRLTFVDSRIIAATNQNLPSLVSSGKFRQDLFFRLNVLNITAPPLRERPEDIMLLLDHFVKNMDQQAEFKLPDWAVQRLVTYLWPGNVRELENFIERLISQTGGVTEQEFTEKLKDLINELSLVENIAHLTMNNNHEDHLLIKIDTLKGMEQQILSKLKHNHFTSKEHLAHMLGISRATLWRKLKGE